MPRHPKSSAKETSPCWSVMSSAARHPRSTGSTRECGSNWIRTVREHLGGVSPPSASNSSASKPHAASLLIILCLHPGNSSTHHARWRTGMSSRTFWLIYRAGSQRKWQCSALVYVTLSIWMQEVEGIISVEIRLDPIRGCVWVNPPGEGNWGVRDR